MKIGDIRTLYGASPQLVTFKNLLENKHEKTVFLQGLLASSASVFFSVAADFIKGHVVFVLQDNEEANYFYNDLRQLLDEESVLLLPTSYRRGIKYGQHDAASEVLRADVLARLTAGNATQLLIVTSPDGLSELVPSRKQVSGQIVKLQVGQEIDSDVLVEHLQELGFQLVDYVYEPGQIAVRGSIVDVYSFSSEYPFRIDFYGDEIDTLRTFDVQDQLSRQKKEQIEILPQMAAAKESKVSLLDYLSDDAVIVFRDLSFIREMIKQNFKDGFLQQAVTEQLSQIPETERAEAMNRFQRDRQLLSGADFDREISRFRIVDFGAAISSRKSADMSFRMELQPQFHKNFDLLKDTLRDYSEKGYHIYILADNPKQQQRLHEILQSQQETAHGGQAERTARAVDFISVDKTLHAGFVDHDRKLCLFTDHQIFDRFHKYQLRSDVARRGKVALSMKELHELEVGDYLVHVDLGIGKFAGLVRVPTGSSYQEVIRIVYQRGDIVDVSIHSLYKISKYRSGENGEPPRLSTLGTGAWERLKERTKKKIKDIARDLIRLYAKQKHEKGFAFSPDTFMQHELEASFMYEDTPDQLRATQDVKADMENSHPMDRLVCGDVGFGKTEIAIRAAFKAACDSKQVAVLVPTTVLAFQHYQTFSERLKQLPVRVDYLTRARSAKQVKELLADLQQGKIDILIGTHKLIGKQVKWKDLGLLIIDEEQKFGVAVKEKLRMMKSNVDTITMSATPIPRTLQFSLMGARDMSILRTPPANRYPIQTEVSTYSKDVIVDAVNFEMSRNGQVFFVNNRINSLYDHARVLQKYIPDCRIAIGHGKMSPDELEQILIGFINHDYDVLLSTTIVENGIDIPNANTIIINDAHKFGLSDLHQMRGRVGRGNRKAFCYLLAPPKAVITTEARRRLEALENFSELGSGFSLALQDLDIRGAGNLLGAEQSGFMEDLGYETYEKILKEAMAELRNENAIEETEDAENRDNGGKVNQGKNRVAHGEDISNMYASTVSYYVADCAIDSDLEMYFPDRYVPGSSERMLLYRELENMETDMDLHAYRERLQDRFGTIPKQGEELLQVVALRRVGKQLGCEKIQLRQGRMTLHFPSNVLSPYYQSNVFGAMVTYATQNYQRCQLKEMKGRRMMHISNVKSAAQAVELLREIANI